MTSSKSEYQKYTRGFDVREGGNEKQEINFAFMA